MVKLNANKYYEKVNERTYKAINTLAVNTFIFANRFTEVFILYILGWKMLLRCIANSTVLSTVSCGIPFQCFVGLTRKLGLKVRRFEVSAPKF